MIICVPNTKEGLLQAESMRGPHIMGGNGVLLIKEDCDGGNKELLEKILKGVEFNPALSVDEQPWKNDPLILLVGKAKDKLAEFEELLPGFSKKFGPAKTISIN